MQMKKGIGINLKLNWDCITLQYMENNTVALRIFFGVYVCYFDMYCLDN